MDSMESQASLSSLEDLGVFNKHAEGKNQKIVGMERAMALFTGMSMRDATQKFGDETNTDAFYSQYEPSAGG